MLENAAQVWKLSMRDGAVDVRLPDLSGLDAITRLLPQGYYSTFRTFDGGKRVLGLRAHLQRLYQPADRDQIKPTAPVDFLRSHLALILHEYSKEARVRVIMSKSGQVYVALQPLKPLPTEIYSQGVKVVTTNVRRQNPRLKSTAFISASEGERTKIASNEIFEGLLLQNDFILEGMTSNFFYVRDGILGTARQNVLLGITRRTVLRVARRAGISIAYRALKREQVPVLDEAFLTSSSRGIVPIVQIDEMSVGERSPGSKTKMLSNAYNEYVLRHAELISFSAIQ